jgi:hypothetical protein
MFITLDFGFSIHASKEKTEPRQEYPADLKIKNTSPKTTILQFLMRSVIKD